MKRLLLSAILAVGLHVGLLWVDFGWTDRQPTFSPNSPPVILTLAFRPLPGPIPAPEPVEPASPPSPKPAPEIKKLFMAPDIESGPRPESQARVEPKPQMGPDPLPEPVPEMNLETEPQQKLRVESEPVAAEIAAVEPLPPFPDAPPPSLSSGESRPHFESPAEAIAGPEQTQISEVATEPEIDPPAVSEEDGSKQAAAPASLGIKAAVPVVREARPRYRTNPAPQYPALARKRGYQGTVVLDVFVDRRGRVADRRVFTSSGYASLDRAALKSVAVWLFEPGMREEVPIEMWVKVPITFQLR